MNANLTASVDILADTNPVCAGTTVTISASPTNGGGTPSYQWYKGTNKVGSDSPEYGYIPADGDVITVLMTSSIASCLTGSPALSNPVVMTVNPRLTASVTVEPNVNPICENTAVLFTAKPVNGGDEPTYRWFAGTTLLEESGPVISYIPAKDDVISAVMTSSESSCLEGSPATSNPVTMTILPAQTASVAIVTDNSTVCEGTTVLFTATPTNGGTVPSYQWIKNDELVGQDSPTFSCIPLNGDLIYVRMISDVIHCMTGNYINSSNTITMNVNSALTANVSIAADTNPVCAGTNVTFRANPTYGGDNPLYQWYNGVNLVGTNSREFTYAPADGDKIKVVMTSNSSSCLLNSPATSNEITMSAKSFLTASVSIAAEAISVCTGTSVTFTATPTNGGVNPSYQWDNGGIPVGTNSVTYDYIPKDADKITVVMTPDATLCMSGDPATSNELTMTVKPVLPNSPFSIIVDPPSGNLCAGIAVKLTASSNDLTFDGNDDYVDLEDINELNGTTKFTIETMVYYTESGVSKTLFSKRFDHYNKIQLFSNLVFAVANNGDLMEATITSSIPPFTWVHLAAVYDADGATNADKMKIYIDGVAQSLDFNGEIPLSTAVNSAPALIGSESADAYANVCFTGKMNDFRIWNTARSAAQILSSVNQSLSGLTTGLIAEYRFNEVPGSTTAANSAGSGYNGTLVNFYTTDPWNLDTIEPWNPNHSNADKVPSFSWTGGITNGKSFNPKASGTYTVTADGATCNDEASQSVMITVNPIPTITITGPATALGNYAGNVYTTEAGMTGYTWEVSAGGTITSGSGTRSITVTWNTAGAQTVGVNYTNSNGCTGVSSTLFDVMVDTPDKPISLSAVAGTGKVTIYFAVPSNSGGSAITNYQYSIDNGLSWSSFSPETSKSPVVITGLTNGTTYLVKLRAINSAGPGTPSGSISVKPVATITWLGGNSGNANDWDEPLNWDGGVPGPNDIVVIPNVTYKPEANTLSVDAGGKLTINPNGSVSLAGASTNNGTIVIKSDANGSGSLIASTTLNGSGNALVERYMSENAWHIISSPTGNQSIKAFIDDNLDIPVISGASPVKYGMMDYNPVTDTWNPYFTDTTTRALGLGKGYMVRVQDPVENLRFKGIINATATVAVDEGWNCIGNPFTSAVYISAAAGTANFMATNSSAFETGYAGLYFWDQMTTKYISVNNISSYTAAIGQGFFMKVKKDVHSVLFTPAMQVHQYDAPFKAAHSEYPSIKLTAQSGTTSFTTDIKFIEGTTNGLDFGYDAGLFTTDKSFAFYTKLVDDNGVNFQLQCLPPTGYDKLAIPVGIDSKAGGEIVFSVETVQLDPTCKVILEDKLTNTFTDLSKNSYKAVVLANTSGTGRFFLHTGDIISGVEDQVLPGKLTAYAIRNVELRIVGEVGGSAVATLYNGLGKVVLTKKLGAGRLNIIGLPNLSSGIYLLNIDDKGTTQTIKIMIR